MTPTPLYVYRSLAALIIAGCLLLATAAVAADEIYRSTDAQGRRVYSDRPLGRGAERVAVEPPPRSAVEGAARAARELAELARREEARGRSLAAAEAEKQRSESEKKERRARCIAARDRHLMFAEGRRLYRRDEGGNRAYYTSAEIDAERKASRQKMDEACREQQR